MTSHNMNHHEGFAVLVASFILGPVLALFGVLPHDMLDRFITLAASGIITGGFGLLAQRILRNILKRIATARYFPSILKDEDGK